jgi:pimeloyl-ACP methyl ester carboxylesterase
MSTLTIKDDMSNLTISSRPKVSFFTPGRRTPHKDSYIIVDQAFVQYRRSSQQTIPKTLPILFIHGGGLSGAQWESTPDMRPGWACLANDMGYDVFLLDTVDNGRSARAPDHIRNNAVVEHRTAKELWMRFRFGPFEKFDARQTFLDSQFPIQHFDTLVASQTSRRRSNDDVEARGVADALKTLGECLVIAHSHGAALMMDILGITNLQDSVLQNVKRMVLVEPGGTSSAMHLTEKVPTLVVWGDYVDIHEAWPRISKPFDDSAAEVLRLPEINIKGNSHFPMSDKNSDEVFGVIVKWLEEIKGR